ncbi:pyocin knob domain-containing protein [Microbacterium sp. NIBRBAC000506063]|uniref:pyocin knob domain-containing protein n=1 Tax=Microbacterium sp. NIBRBAC000506063 TaxID=2734618 RepID=UPI001BB5191B|nr:pyocin knob domain-containing protein [Microbacterium sp. NIBRBAC000506063]QTV79493.1 hypothetical protein KAE78_11355 [Microbacterium sp. NIBRBAC000506063]
MTSVFEELWAAIRELKANRGPVVRWGTVATGSPLTVFLDGSLDTAGSPVPSPARSVIPDLRAGDRVLCVEQHRRVTVANVAGRARLVEVTDLNDAITPGFHWCAGDAANNPAGFELVVLAEATDAGAIVQTAHRSGTTSSSALRTEWRRRRSAAGAWTGWLEISNPAIADGIVSASVAANTTASFSVTFPAACSLRHRTSRRPCRSTIRTCTPSRTTTAPHPG